MADQVHRASTELSALVPELWSSRYYDVLLESLPFESLINRDWEGEISSLGDTVNISQFPQFSAATEMSEDARNDADAITVSQIQLVINKRVVKDFIVTKRALLQSLPAMDKLRELAIFAIQKRVQQLIINDIVPNAATPDHSIAYASSPTLALADILSARTLLDAQDVPQENRHGVMGSSQWNDVFAIAEFQNRDFLLSGAPLNSGLIPDNLAGFKPHMTTVLGDTSYWFHPSFMSIASQQGMNVGQFDLGSEGKRAQRVNVDSLIGIKQLDGLRVVSLS